jgi:ketosteroid isomerase-like protein
MKTIVTMFLLVGASISIFAQNKSEEEIRILEKQEVTAFLTQDYKTLDKLWDKNLIVNSAKNIIEHNAQEVKDLLKAGVIKNAEMERTVEEVSIHENVAISMGSEMVKSMQGKVVKRRFTNIWLKTQDGWKLTASQHSIICQ